MPPQLRRPLVRALCLALPAIAGAGVAQADTSNANVTTVATLGTTAAAGTGARGDLLLANDGNVYAVTSAGGDANAGAVVRLGTDGSVNVLHSFAGPDAEGAGAYAGVTQASDGALYGTTYFGGSRNLGVVYRVTLAGTYATLHNFDNREKGGFFPYTGLTQLGAGDLYGTTLRGGANDAGTVYRISLSGTFTQLHEFNGSDGKNPEGKLAAGPDGALYGTTLIGGNDDRGTVFRLTADGQLTTVYSFPRLGAFNDAGVATNDTGANPRAGLTLGPDGNFYGTTYQGGVRGFGTVFRLTPQGALTVLHAFQGAPFDGASPLGGVSIGPDGSLYGTTERGGASNVGITWRIDAAGNYQVLHPFTGTSADGSTPYNTLLPLGGAAYGLSFTDGSYGAGSFFRVEFPSAGALPVRVTASPDRITVGQSATLTWSAPGATSCTGSGAWPSGDIAASGTQPIAPVAAGFYNFVLSCKDAAGVTRLAYATLAVSTPELKPVDAGGDGGGGAAAPTLLALLGGTLFFAVRQRRRA